MDLRLKHFDWLKTEKLRVLNLYEDFRLGCSDSHSRAVPCGPTIDKPKTGSTRAELLFFLGSVAAVVGVNTDHWVDSMGDHYGLWNYCNIQGCRPFLEETIQEWLKSARLCAGAAEVLMAIAGIILLLTTCRRRCIPFDPTVVNECPCHLATGTLSAAAGLLTLAAVYRVQHHVEAPSKVHASWSLSLLAGVMLLVCSGLQGHRVYKLLRPDRPGRQQPAPATHHSGTQIA